MACQPIDETTLGRCYSSLAVFLMGAIVLVVPSGYTYGAGLLLLGSLILLYLRPALHLQQEDRQLMAVLAMYSLLFCAQLWLEGADASAFDRPSRFIFAVPVLLFVLAYPPRLALLWSGLVVGGLLTAGWAVWQKLFLGIERATGYTYVIQFGNISMLMGIFCLAGLGWAAVQPRARSWMAFMLLGALAGMLGSLLSGSRGGWIGLPLIFWMLYRAYGREVRRSIRLWGLALVCTGAVLLYSLPQTGLHSRVQQAFTDIELFQQGDKWTSLGARLDMWQGALQLIAEKPLTGWGWSGYRQGMQALADDGIVIQFAAENHAHNEMLDAQARRGILGLLSLLALYLVPLRLFSRRLRAEDLELRSLALAGALLPVAFMDFGLSQVFFGHNSGVMVYAFWLVVLWGCMRTRERQLGQVR